MAVYPDRYNQWLKRDEQRLLSTSVMGPQGITFEIGKRDGKRKARVTLDHETALKLAEDIIAKAKGESQ